MMTVKRVVLCSRPGKTGVPVPENFRVEETTLNPELDYGDVLVRTLYLSVDPYMRCKMNEQTDTEYVPRWELFECADGGGLGIVEDSQCVLHAKGDLVISFHMPWQTYAVVDGTTLSKVDPQLVSEENRSHLLGTVGFTGLTALLAVRERGHVIKGTNKTLVVSGAAGGCGSAAGQIGRLDGCATVVGICGTDEKCKIVVDELGFDGSINYKQEDVAARLKELCPNGIDIYFDNVGGPISEAVISQMNIGGHVIVCGQISQYNKPLPVYPPPLSDEVEQYVQNNTITRQHFLILGYMSKIEPALVELSQMVKSGRLKVLETVMNGLENMGAAFCSMMEGGNIGKMVVKIAD